VKKIRVPRVPALEPVAQFTVEFSTVDEKRHPSTKETRMVAARDEVEAVNAVRRYFAVEQILSISRQGYVYLTPTAMRLVLPRNPVTRPSVVNAP
jgi:hypothetical protein